MPIAGRGVPALAVGEVSVADLAQGLAGADRRGERGCVLAPNACFGLSPHLIFRWRFQLSIRSLLVLTVAVTILYCHANPYGNLGVKSTF